MYSTEIVKKDEIPKPDEQWYNNGITDTFKIRCWLTIAEGVTQFFYASWIWNLHEIYTIDL